MSLQNELEELKPVEESGSSLELYSREWMSEATAARYEESRRKGCYGHFQTEEYILDRWLSQCPPGSIVLDCPCGTGRFTQFLIKAGYRLIQADRSLSMLNRARESTRLSGVALSVCCDLAAPPFGRKSADAVLLWRIFHHLRSDEARYLILKNIAEVARQFVIVSFYNRASLTFWTQKTLRAVAGRFEKLRGAVWESHLRSIASDAGLVPVDVFHYRRFISINSAMLFRPA